jgi:hypothetical protein
MPDPSADRPLLLPEEPFTEEDVDLLDHALVAADCVHGAIGPGHVGCTLACSRCIARKALAALAAAGRLLPASAEHREEWTYTATIGNVDRHGEDNAEAYETREDAVAQIAFTRQHYPALSVTDVRYVRRDVFTGPWTEVDGSTADA